MPDADAVQLLQHAAANGVTFWDTAEVYTCKADDGASTIYNEVVVGKALAAVGRERVQIATKYMPKIHGSSMTSDTVMAACAASCQRLGVEHVDLYYVHRIHPTVPVEEQAMAMKSVLDRGLAKHIGVSEFSAENLRRFHEVCPVTAVQQEWSLVNRDLENKIVPACRDLGIGIVAYSPLCRSLLSGAIRTAADLSGGDADLRPQRYPRFSAENLPKNSSLVHGVKSLASSRSLSAAQLSLAWVAGQGLDVVPIPGTTKIEHLMENIASQEVDLTKEELDLIAASVPVDKVSGDRYTGGADALTFRDQGVNA